MRRLAGTLAVAAALLAPAGAGAVPTRSDTAPLLTRWAAEVSRTDPRPEYPRPQARRERWKSLNGRWRVSLGIGRPRPILVPFPYQAPLSGIGRTGIHERVVYRRTFAVPRGWRGERVILHFGAVDWEATVSVNGRRVGTHRGGYTPFSFDVTDALRRDGPQRLTVAVRDPAGRDATQPLGKQLSRGRIYYTRTTGIWQTVWVEPVARRHVRSVRMAPDLAGQRLGVSARVARGGGATLGVRVSRAGATVAESEAPVAADGIAKATLAVPDPAPWSPASPALYDVTLTVRHGGREADRLRSYTAFRTVDVQGGRVRLNGEPYLLRGVLDQGYWPDGLYAAPTDDALRHDVVMAKRHGFNLARMHQKVADPRWYWHADRLGLLVAQDMPASRNLTTAPARAQFEGEWLEMIDTLRDHPSVVIWTAFNENWGRPSPAFQSRVVDLARAADPTRPIIDASGSIRRANSDIVDFHDYGDNLARYDVRTPSRARWVGEYGGVTLKVPGRVWRRGPLRDRAGGRSRAEAFERFALLTGQLTGATGLSGFVYTQLADVEQELNGLMTYDRATKFDPRRVREIVRPPAR